jgi:hypothetical protein
LTNGLFHGLIHIPNFPYNGRFCGVLPVAMVGLTGHERPGFFAV